MTEPSAEPKDRDATRLALLAVALLVAEQVAARAVRDALFLSAYRVRSLPLMMMASALVAVAAAETASRMLARHSPARVVPTGALVSAALLALLWPLAAFAPRAAAVLVYLHVAAFGGALVSGFWSLVNERFDPYTARRVVGTIGTGATAGGVAGGLIGWAAAQLLPVPLTLLVLATLHGASALALRRAGRAQAATSTPAAPSPGSGLAVLLRIPYLRELALVFTLGALVETILDWSFKAEVQRQFAGGGGRALLGPLALFYGGMSVLSLLLQWLLARPSLERLGIAGTMSIRPLLTAAGSVLGALWPRLSTTTFARGAHEALTNSLFRSAYELLYTPVPEAEKRRVKAFVDVALDKGGALVASWLILGMLAVLPNGAERVLLALAAVLSLSALALSRRLHPGYVGALEQSLLQGRVRLDPTELVDPDTRLTLARTSLIDRGTLLQQIAELRASSPAAGRPAEVSPTAAGGERDAVAAASDRLAPSLAELRSGDPARVRRALATLTDPTPEAVAVLVPLLASDHVFAEVLAALRRAAPRVTGQLVDALLDRGSDLVVRRRIARVLRGCPTQRAVLGLAAALEEPSAEVRFAAASALAALHERSGIAGLSRERVLDEVRRELDSGQPVDRQLPHVFALLSLWLERDALQIAWAAMKTNDRTLRGTALEYLNNVLPDDVFPRLRSLFGASSLFFEARQRSVAQVADELRTSAVRLRLENPPWQEGDADQSAGS